MHEDRGRALSFGGVAQLYDRARPSYPPALIDDLMAFSPRRVLDVGCGTGKAARLFVDRGCDVLGVEPDASMAALARGHGIRVEEATFEQWDARGRRFDMIVSGQAWHWVDPEVGAAKAASILRAGGHLAVFWNGGSVDNDAGEALGAVYRRIAPDIAKTTFTLQRPTEPRDRVEALRDEGSFASVETRTYRWESVYDRAGWVDFIATHSDHVQLPDPQRHALLDAVGEAIDALGDTLTYHYATLLVLATRAM